MSRTVWRTEVRVRVFGTRDSWTLSGYPGGDQPGTMCTVHLAIEGDDRDGYHLIQSPEGFFTADSWHATADEARTSAEALFGVLAERWQAASS